MSDGRRLAPTARLRLRAPDEPDVVTEWAAFRADNDEAPFLEDVEAALLDGRVYQGGGGAAPEFSVELEERYPGANRAVVLWAEGKCRRCGSPREASDLHCDVCLVKERERARARTGSKPWRPGGPGRPPKGPRA